MSTRIASATEIQQQQEREGNEDWGQVGGLVGAWTMTNNWYANKNLRRKMIGKKKRRDKRERGGQQKATSLGTGSQSREATPYR